MLRVPNRANARIGRKGQPLFSTLLSSVASFANTITITGEPDAGTLTSATAGDTYSELLVLVNEGTATTDGPGGVTITPTLTGSSSNPVEEDDVITGFSVVYTATDAAPVVRIVTFDPVITVPAPIPAPVITGLPTISGVERVGELLTATPASVTNGGVLTWQWFANGVAIEGAESITFLLTLGQEGSTITVQQTQTNDTGADTATSTATGAIVHVAPTASNALADQSFTIGTGVQTYAAAGDFTGEELSFSLNTITGVTVNAATGVVSFDTDTMALQASTSIIVTATNTGGSVQSGFGVSITAVAFAFTDNGDGTLDVTTEGTAPTPTVTNNGDGTATTNEAGAYIYKPSANAEDDFSGAVGSSTLATATGAGTFKVYKRVASSVAVTAAPSFADPNDLGAKLKIWMDFTDTTQMWTGLALTGSNITTNGQVAKSIANKATSGISGGFDMQNNATAVWDAANEQVNYNPTDDIGKIIGIDVLGAGELSATSEVYFGMKTSDNKFILLTKDPNFSYAGVAEDGSASTDISNNIGTFSHRINNTIVSPTTQDDVHTNYSTGTGIVGGFSNLNLTPWNGARPAFLSLANFSGWNFSGQLTHIIMTDALTTQERIDLHTWMSARLPV